METVSIFVSTFVAAPPAVVMLITLARGIRCLRIEVSGSWEWRRPGPAAA